MTNCNLCTLLYLHANTQFLLFMFLIMHIASYYVTRVTYIMYSIMSSYIAIAMHRYVTLDLKAKVASYI